MSDSESVDYNRATGRDLRRNHGAGTKEDLMRSVKTYPTIAAGSETPRATADGSGGAPEKFFQTGKKLSRVIMCAPYKPRDRFSLSLKKRNGRNPKKPAPPIATVLGGNTPVEVRKQVHLVHKNQTADTKK